MRNISDSYKTILKPSEVVLFKEKKSKFYGYTFPIQSDDEVKSICTVLKKKHPSAGHLCYAWQLGTAIKRYRANDDGEPNNSAGQPIYGQIQAFEVTNVLVVVVRIFGGTKLGVGGLISAYRTTAQMALSASQIIDKIIETQFSLLFDYDDMDKVMRIIKQKKYTIVDQQLEMNCNLIIAIRQSEASNFKLFFSDLHKVKIKEIES